MQPYSFDSEPEAEAPPQAEPERPAGWRFIFADTVQDDLVERHVEVAGARNQRWMGRTIMVTVAALAIFNSASITSWASTLPPNWATETIRAVAKVWSERLSELGLDQPRAAIRGAYEAQKAKTWS